MQIFNHPFLFLAKDFKENVEISQFANFSFSLPVIKNVENHFIFVANSLVFWKAIRRRNEFLNLRNRQKWPQFPSKWNGAWDFLLSYFENRQIWLNELEDARHLSNVNKFWGKRKRKTLFWISNFAFLAKFRQLFLKKRS